MPRGSLCQVLVKAKGKWLKYLEPHSVLSHQASFQVMGSQSCQGWFITEQNLKLFAEGPQLSRFDEFGHFVLLLRTVPLSEQGNSPHRYFSQSSSLHPMGVFPLEGGWPSGRPQVMTTHRNSWLCCFECSLVTLSPPMKQPHPQDIKMATVKVLLPVCPHWTHAAFC